jgi:hypothetical protein
MEQLTRVNGQKVKLRAWESSLILMMTLIKESGKTTKQMAGESLQELKTLNSSRLHLS